MSAPAPPPPLDPEVQRVVVIGKKPPSDDVTILVNGQAYGGWTSLRITRGIERCPSDFELQTTERYPSYVDALQITPQDACVVKIGSDKVLTGYVDIVHPQLSKDAHAIAILGRSKCEDLVDCSAEWAGGQITGSSVLEVATKLAAPYGISVKALTDPGPPLPIYQLNQGETPFEIIEKLCRYRQLLCYDGPDGNLVLSAVGTVRAASGFQEGMNVEAADFAFSAHQRFQTYISYSMSTESYNDLGGVDYTNATAGDDGIRRHRVRKIVCPVSGPLGIAFAQDRIIWEAARRLGRSYAVSITTDGWRDQAGLLYEPNTLVRVQLPSLKLPSVVWTISEVTYRKGPDGTFCDLLIMPPQAFIPEPDLTFQIAAELVGQAPGP